jgi:hypothetical protein
MCSVIALLAASETLIRSATRRNLNVMLFLFAARAPSRYHATRIARRIGQSLDQAGRRAVFYATRSSRGRGRDHVRASRMATSLGYAAQMA